MYVNGRCTTIEIHDGYPYSDYVVTLRTYVPQIRPLADILHFKYAPTYLLTYLCNRSVYRVWSLQLKN